MKVAGTVKTGDQEFILMMNYKKSQTYYYLLSPYHKDDLTNKVFGGNIQYEIRNLIHYTANTVDIDYVHGAIKRKNIGGELYYYGSSDVLLSVLEAIRLSVTYSFKESDIVRAPDPFVNSDGMLQKEFSARDERYLIDYVKVAGVIQQLRFKSFDLEIDFKISHNHKFPSEKLIGPKMSLMNVKKKSKLYYSSVKSIDFESVIKDMGDVSWYFDEIDEKRIYKKDYRSVGNKENFEKSIILGLKHAIEEARRENTLPVIVGEDTETDGLNVYDIPKEYQSTVVAIPIAFKDEQAFLIYTDMECFENIPIEYVKERLEPFFKKNLLSDDDITIETLEGPFTFKRSEILLTGHNTMFDICAQAVHNFEVWFDVDTMQMSFNLDPFITKGRNSLKEITHFLFNHNTPELTDVLGKGNADKFRNITDERVAIMYGCADADYSRKVFKALREIYRQCEAFHGKDLFKVYKDQDSLLMNVCAMMDFPGLRIHKEAFIEAGKHSLADMEIIRNFAYKYVGRVVVANNYIRQKQAVDEAIRASGGEISPNEVKYPSIPDIENCKPHEFKFAGNDLIETLYNTLGYPVLIRTEPPKSKSDGTKPDSGLGRPAINKNAMKKLMQRVHDKPVETLSKDVMGSNGKVLIKAKEFNKYKYPVAYLVSLLGPRKKEYDSYFRPFVEESFDDRLCKSTSFSRIDTRRISNPIQTIKASLKYAILPHSDEYALCDFDMSQVELRIMTSLAHDCYMIKRMGSPEIDNHIETAAQMFFKETADVSSDERKYAKQVNFGYPYGLMQFSMCEKIFSDNSPQHMYETGLIIEAFEEARKLVVEFLNKVREEAITPIEVPEVLRKYLRIEGDIPLGIVRNLKGFYKLFKLDNMTEKKKARIGRQAGNFPIQGFAAELFRLVLIRFYLACEREGWNQKGWIQWHMLVHDELLFSFKKKDIHPVYLCKVLYENCMIRLHHNKTKEELKITAEELVSKYGAAPEDAEGIAKNTRWEHTKYFIGINIGETWGQCKDDSSELPVYCVSRLVKRWDNGEFEGEVVEDPTSYIHEKRREYIRDRISEIVGSIYPKMKDGILDVREINPRLKNYIVKKYIQDDYKPLWEPREYSKKRAELDFFSACLARWGLDYYGSNSFTFITGDGEEVVVTSEHGDKFILDGNGKKKPVSFECLFEGKEMDIEQVVVEEIASEDDSYYKELDWDLAGGEGFAYNVYEESEGEESYVDYFDDSKGTTLESMRRVSGVTYDNIKVYRNKVYVHVNRASILSKVVSHIREKNWGNPDGLECWYKTHTFTKGLPISNSCLSDLDSFINELKGGK